jgi:hypothetical protein
MTIKSYPYKGNEVYVVSECDLRIIKEHGNEYRVYCPVHNSRDGDASIHGYHPDMDEDEASLAGWGKCFGISCNAVILVREWNPRAAAWVTRKPYDESEAVKPAITLKQMELKADWQTYELMALKKLSALMKGRLVHPRCVAYHKQRGYDLLNPQVMSVAQQLGMGYIPPLDEWTVSPQQMCQRLFKNTEKDYSWVLNKWCDRVIFPFTTPDDELGFAGRTLGLWVPGMDENEHKQLLNEHEKECLASGKYNLYRRHEKTYRNGIINAQAMAKHRDIRMTESGFDLIPWLIEGYDNTVAVSGNNFNPSFIPSNVRHVNIAFDTDIKIPTIEMLQEKFGDAGILSDITIPPTDEFGKDWNERYRNIGLAGLASDTETRDALLEPCLCSVCDEQGIETPALPDDYEGMMYCAAHHPKPQGKTQVQALEQKITVMQQTIDGLLVPERQPIV